MIPYEDLCRALDQYNARRRNAEEMEQLDQISEAPAPGEPVFQDAAPVDAAFVEAAPVEAAPVEAAPVEGAPVAPAHDSAPVEPVQGEMGLEEAAAPSALEEPTIQSPLDMGSTDQIFAPGSEMPYSPSDPAANTAENAMPYLEQATDMTAVDPAPEEVPAGLEETTQEFDIEEAEEVEEKDLGN